MENLTQILEAILFASGTSKKKSDILELLPNATKAQFDKSVEILKIGRASCRDRVSAVV